MAALARQLSIPHRDNDDFDDSLEERRFKASRGSTSNGCEAFTRSYFDRAMSDSSRQYTSTCSQSWLTFRRGSYNDLCPVLLAQHPAPMFLQPSYCSRRPYRLSNNRACCNSMFKHMRTLVLKNGHSAAAARVHALPATGT